ncbi:hypothetical protein K0M31_018485 [Melipona bicolor]|uniref:Uncharacterized protein n=1 Tax=Melipona bicolor TaxID=60889 RepID=A0AA40G454_9HYME|nr:hypothetical protein K0M31_018485 [Melipona bicolor]
MLRNKRSTVLRYRPPLYPTNNSPPDTEEPVVSPTDRSYGARRNEGRVGLAPPCLIYPFGRRGASSHVPRGSLAFFEPPPPVQTRPTTPLLAERLFKAARYIQPGTDTQRPDRENGQESRYLWKGGEIEKGDERGTKVLGGGTRGSLRVEHIPGELERSFQEEEGDWQPANPPLRALSGRGVCPIFTFG